MQSSSDESLGLGKVGLKSRSHHVLDDIVASASVCSLALVYLHGAVISTSVQCVPRVDQHDIVEIFQAVLYDWDWSRPSHNSLP